MNAESAGATPLLSGIVVHWHDETGLEALAASWPEDGRFELVVVDNGSRRPLSPARGRVLDPGANLGFAAGVNFGVSKSSAPLLLLLNSDVRTRPGALEDLVDGFSAHSEAAGLAPRLIGPGGEGQAAWQLRSLPTFGGLLAQSLLLPALNRTGGEPQAGEAVEQPAAAVLALRRSVFVALGGMDERFYPAWFEDVDLARRLAANDQLVLYWPTAIFEHRLGATATELGYRRFLWSYQRNLDRYVRKHYGAWAQTTTRVTRSFGTLLRALLLPLRRPRRASSRSNALLGLTELFLGTLSGWRRPSSAARFTRPDSHQSESPHAEASQSGQSREEP